MPSIVPRHTALQILFLFIELLYIRTISRNLTLQIETHMIYTIHGTAARQRTHSDE